MSISRTLVILALAAAPATLMAQQSPATTMAGDTPFTFRPTAEKDTLWTIVAETVPLGPQVSVNQAMVAILRQNPNAFVRGNLHVLRKGVVLTIPSLAQIRAEDRIRSGAVIEQHLRLLTEGAKERAPLYEIKSLPVAPVAPAASAASAPAGPVRPPAVPASAVPPARVASAPASAPAPASAAAPMPAPAPASAAVPSPVAPAASAVASAPAVAASAPAVAASAAPPVLASEPAAPASAAEPAVPVASAPASAVSAPTSGAAYLTYLAAGAALLGVALWAWRRRSGPSAAADAASAEPAESNGPRLVQVSTAAVDTARSVDAMKPVLELVRNDAEASASTPQDVSGQATLNLQVARAYVELRRFDEAYVLLQYVAQHGSPEEQQEAQTLLRGSS